LYAKQYLDIFIYVVILTVVSEGSEENGFLPFVSQRLHPMSIYEYTCAGRDFYTLIVHRDAGADSHRLSNGRSNALLLFIHVKFQGIVDTLEIICFHVDTVILEIKKERVLWRRVSLFFLSSSYFSPL